LGTLIKEEFMEDLTDKEINLLKIKKVKNLSEYIQKEIEYDLMPNELVLNDIMELLIDIKRSVKNGRL
jgi:archaellum biogenesis ATPase FlaH